MDVSVFFAQLWGGFYLVFGALFIVTGQLGRTIEMTDDRAFVVSTGYVTFFLGLVTIILHNIWVADWRVIITLLGWTTLLKAIQKIAFPEFIHTQAQRFRRGQHLSGAFLLLLGAYLLWMGHKGTGRWL